MRIPFAASLLAVILSAEVCAADKDNILDVYVEVATALAADDLDTAKKNSVTLAEITKKSGMADLSEEASAVSEAAEIEDAREKFKLVSAEVIPMAKGNDSFYIMNCPMTENGNWVQKDPQVANPYFGASMLHCGSIVEE